MDVSLQIMAQKLKEHSAYKIYYHEKPDGDAVMSAYALAVALQSIGISCEPLCCDGIPDAYKEEISTLSYQPLKADPVEYTNIAVDTAKNKRLGKYKDEEITFCIDHHEHTDKDDNDDGMKAKYKWVVPEASSCAELIYKLILEMGIKVNPEIASLLYIGLITDTLCFRTFATNKESLETAALLAGRGADIVRIARQYALEKTPERVAVEQVLIDSFHFTCNGKVLSAMITYEDLHNMGVEDTRLEGLNIVVDQIKGPEIGIVVRETSKGNCRVSVRTYKGINAVDICREFGGGGHPDRAGFETDEKPEVIIRQVEETAERYLKSKSKS